jgi:hypothetical protein
VIRSVRHKMRRTGRHGKGAFKGNASARLAWTAQRIWKWRP